MNLSALPPTLSAPLTTGHPLSLPATDQPLRDVARVTPAPATADIGERAASPAATGREDDSTAPGAAAAARPEDGAPPEKDGRALPGAAGETGPAPAGTATPGQGPERDARRQAPPTLLQIRINEILREQLDGGGTAPPRPPAG